jgi:hypothetical protein
LLTYICQALPIRFLAGTVLSFLRNKNILFITLISSSWPTFKTPPTFQATTYCSRPLLSEAKPIFGNCRQYRFHGHERRLKTRYCSDILSCSLQASNTEPINLITGEDYLASDTTFSEMPPVSKKRKLPDEATQKYYAVKAGHITGVFETWAECQRNTTGYKGAVCKSLS